MEFRELPVGVYDFDAVVSEARNARRVTRHSVSMSPHVV
jgi:hypothetical protein